MHGSSPSYRKGQEEEDAGQVVFQIVTPTLRKMSCCSRGKIITDTQKLLNTLERRDEGKNESSAIAATPCKLSLPPMLPPELPWRVWVLPDLNMTCDIKSSCKVLMLSQPGRNTRIAPSYREKRE